MHFLKFSKYEIFFRIRGSAGGIRHLENVKSYMSYVQQYTKIIKMPSYVQQYTKIIKMPTLKTYYVSPSISLIFSSASTSASSQRNLSGP